MNEPKSIENRAMAAAVRAERSAAGLSQEAFAQASGINFETFKRILKGDRDINITQISGIARAAGITPAQLVARAEDRLVQLRAEELSEGAPTKDDLETRRLQKEAEQMSLAEIERNAEAALKDEQMDEQPDEPQAP